MLVIGTEKLFSVMTRASWSDKPFMNGFILYFLLLSINILSIKVTELLAILVGKYTVPIRL
jgi:hypothetical protein